MNINELLKEKNIIEEKILECKNELHEKNLNDINECRIKETMTKQEVFDLIEKTIKWTIDIERKSF